MWLPLLLRVQALVPHSLLLFLLVLHLVSALVLVLLLVPLVVVEGCWHQGLKARHREIKVVFNMAGPEQNFDKQYCY